MREPEDHSRPTFDQCTEDFGGGCRLDPAIAEYGNSAPSGSQVGARWPVIDQLGEGAAWIRRTIRVEIDDQRGACCARERQWRNGTEYPVLRCPR